MTVEDQPATQDRAESGAPAPTARPEGVQSEAAQPKGAPPDGSHADTELAKTELAKPGAGGAEPGTIHAETGTPDGSRAADADLGLLRDALAEVRKVIV